VVPISLATLLLRKTDWHDYDGIKWLLENGADPNLTTHWGKTALHNALFRDNALDIIEVLLEHGADPSLKGSLPDVFRSACGKSALQLAARRGRSDVLKLFERRAVRIELQGVERLIAACATNSASIVRSLVQREPSLVSELRAEGGKLLAEFAANGNTEGVRCLLDLGVNVHAIYEEGDGYFQVASNSTALHVAAWRARHETLKLLIVRGAVVNAL